ncbi:unnamed protein product [Lupinus luteus]|uniref:Glycosyltransferase n=1 Tax=Lupinus luteus TaxID=3873 RepID=A0AAV1W1D9_LUPLU
MMKNTIVLYSSIGRGHVFSMVELGNLILTHNPSFSIIILIPTPPNTANIDTTTFGCNSSITFHHLTITPPGSSADTNTIGPHLPIFDITRHGNHNLHHVLQYISKTSNLKAIVVDFMNYSATEVTSTLDIPTLFYYTSGASTFCYLNHLQTIKENRTKSTNDKQAYLEIPGFPTISAQELLHDPRHIEDIFIKISATLSDCDGIIINTFNAFEERAIKTLEEGSCFPQEKNPPPVFCIGPVISMSRGEKDEHGCLSWLDSQPSQNVVLLSFGSLGRFKKNQLKEIAIGLEKSERRFLWVVRSEFDEESLEELLPEGFLERIKEKGMVVKNWAPQAAILSHDSVGGFVTHCGWNSVLEAVCEGVPMVAWPLYAEQKLNRVVLVKEMKVALALEECEDGFVSATELGERVKELMNSEKGKEIRERILNMKVSAVEARAEGGSSYGALNRMTKTWEEKEHLHHFSPNGIFT